MKNTKLFVVLMAVIVMTSFVFGYQIGSPNANAAAVLRAEFELDSTKIFVRGANVGGRYEHGKFIPSTYDVDVLRAKLNLELAKISETNGK